jgi:superfamily II DNA or RNA helicase
VILSFKINFDMILDETKAKRQQEGAMSWNKAGGRGGLVYPTGFGKTFTVLNYICKPMLVKNPNIRIIVLITTTNLKEAWIKGVNDFLPESTANFRIDTAQNFVVNNIYDSCDLLVLDEVDEFYSLRRQELWNGNAIKFRFLVWLSAYPTDTQKRDKEFLAKFPVIDEILESEALENNWITPYNIFCVSIDLTLEERAVYDELSTTVDNYLQKFNGNLKNAYDCLGGAKTEDGEVISAYECCFQWACHNGWNAKYPYALRNPQEFSNEYLEMARVADDNWNPNKVLGYAKELNKAIQSRKKLLNNAEDKMDKILYLYDKYKDKKFITFSNNTDYSDRITQTVNERANKLIALSYHSNLPSRPLYRDANNNLSLLKGEKFDTTKKGVIKKHGSATLRALTLVHHFNNEVSWLNTSEALNKGHDDPEIEIAIINGAASSPNKLIQRKGRTTRKGAKEKALIVYLYCRNTLEEFALQRSLKDTNRANVYFCKIEQVAHEYKPIFEFGL